LERLGNDGLSNRSLYSMVMFWPCRSVDV
jgi:hypothetical protein